MTNEHDVYKLIKYVAIYLRKSRGDESTDLEKHRSILVELCKRHSWKFVQYEEIESGDSIALRPEIQRLLKDIREGLYDAVVTIDIDRLSRGDSGDQDTIKKSLQKNGTFIVTTSNLYNVNDDDDEFRIDIEGLFARQEYKKIKKRLQQGKKIGARQGDWVNGTPPFPYVYQVWGNDFNEKGLVIDRDKLNIYRTMISMALKNVPSNKIAFHLNKVSIPSPRGYKWSPITVDRILKDETHLGKIISNKGIGDSHSKKKPNSKEYRKNPREEWIVVENCHEQVKTQEEHDTILALTRKRKVIPVKARKGYYSLSGIVKCGTCGYGMQFITKKNGTICVKKCQHTDPFGVECTNRGGNANYILDAINQKLQEIEDRILSQIDNVPNSEIQNLKNQIEFCKKELLKKGTALERIQEAYEKGDYELEIYRKRKDKINKESSEIKKDLELLNKQLNSTENVSSEDKLIAIKEFKRNLSQNCSSADLNRLYKTLIDSVIWTRNGDNIDIKINFL